MAQERKFLVIHCTATPEGRDITAEHIRQMHLGPLPLDKGAVMYKGKKYASRAKLPNESYGGVPVSKLTGRGWSKLGYSDLIMLDGSIVNLTPYDDDSEVESWEVTNGASGINSVSTHIVYAGGMNATNTKAKDTRTDAQLQGLRVFVHDFVINHPNVQVCRHNQHANKYCPSFWVPAWCKEIGLEDKNIYMADTYGYGKLLS